MARKAGPKGWPEFLTRLEAAGDLIGWPVFLRTGQGSGKHQWKRTCYVQDAGELPYHVAALVEWSHLVDMLGLPTYVWAVRELLPVEPICTLPRYGDMPLTKESRVFVRDGKVLCSHSYWPEGAIAAGLKCGHEQIGAPPIDLLSLANRCQHCAPDAAALFARLVLTAEESMEAMALASRVAAVFRRVHVGGPAGDEKRLVRNRRGPAGPIVSLAGLSIWPQRHRGTTMRELIRAADLFAGAGGASTGLRRACEALGKQLDLVAVNHWQTAVETHAANHPSARHLCEDLESVSPRKAVPGGRLDLLLAGPECTHHSTARGGKPVNDQSRASAWCVLRWATTLRIDSILIENVREFLSWGPLGVNGRPLRSRKGETFQAFIQALRSLGYRVAWRVLNAADYGDPTTRERLFIQARRGRRQIVWPEPTHSPKGEATLFGPTERWRPARDVIDWGIPGQSIFARKRPLSPNTLARIAAGLKKFGGANAEPFLVLLRGTDASQVNGSAKSLGEPVPTITAGGKHVGLCQPFVLQQQSGGAPRSTENLLPTIATDGAIALVEPFLISAGGPKVEARPISQPANTVLTRDHMALVEPFIISMEHSGAHGQQVRSVDQPLPTITTRGDLRVCEPFVVPTNHGDTKGGNCRAYAVDRPMPTITTVDAWGLIEGFVTKYHGNGAAHPVSEPLRTIDCNDRFALVEPHVNGRLDIRFRMLQVHELAAAMSFPREYLFCGNRKQKVKQIGNAWAGELSYRLSLALLEE